jgi:hypothetical protein
VGIYLIMREIKKNKPIEDLPPSNFETLAFLGLPF